MYEGDSFFTLSVWGQVGLTVLSLVLAAVMIVGVLWGVRGRPRVIGIPAALVAFWLFVWLSPQVYYQYYRLIFDGLPAQWVVWPPRWPAEAFDLLLFQGPANLSAHGQGVLGWAMIACATLGRRRFRNRPVQ